MVGVPHSTGCALCRERHIKVSQTKLRLLPLPRQRTHSSPFSESILLTRNQVRRSSSRMHPMPALRPHLPRISSHLSLPRRGSKSKAPTSLHYSRARPRGFNGLKHPQHSWHNHTPNRAIWPIRARRGCSRRSRQCHRLDASAFVNGYTRRECVAITGAQDVPGSAAAIISGFHQRVFSNIVLS